MTGQFALTLTITDGDTGVTKTIHDLPVLKGLSREGRVAAFADALSRLFEAIDPPTQDTP